MEATAAAEQLQRLQAELARVQQEVGVLTTERAQQAEQLQAAQRSEQSLLTMLGRHLGRRQAHARLSPTPQFNPSPSQPRTLTLTLTLTLTPTRRTRA